MFQEQARPHRCSTVVILAGFALGLPFLVGFEGQQPNQVKGATPFPGHLERPNDPPATPATRTGPALRGIITPPGFTFVQVNTNAAGSNIFGDAANEPSIAIDPTNPNKMAIGWRQFDSVLSDFREAGFAFSTDAGRTWTFPGVLQQSFFRSDPVLDSSPEGIFYYNSLQSSFRTDVWQSQDGGATWPVLVPAFGGDKAWMVVDKTDSIGRGNIYAAWSVFAGCCGNQTFSRSTDGGQTWLNPIGVSGTPIFGTLAVGPEGELYVAGVNPSDFSQFRVAKSTSARDASMTPTFDGFVNVNMGGVMAIGAGPNPDGLLGQVWVACDTSGGPRNGWVYLLATVDPPGSDPMNVKFSRSTDGGQTWSTPKTINTDGVTGTWQWFGTMSVAPNGRIDVIWNDNRHNVFTISETRLFYSFSEDGGDTWSANMPGSDIWNPLAGHPQQAKIGDYYHLVSDNVGASLAYAATFNNEQDVYFVRINEFDCNANGVGDETEVASGAVTDFNGNGIPDGCDGLGDMNCDDRVNLDDVDPMVLALIDINAYQAAFPKCSSLRGDIDNDAQLTVHDLQFFIAVLVGGA